MAAPFIIPINWITRLNLILVAYPLMANNLLKRIPNSSSWRSMISRIWALKRCLGQGLMRVLKKSENVGQNNSQDQIKKFRRDCTVELTIAKSKIIMSSWNTGKSRKMLRLRSSFRHRGVFNHVRTIEN